MPISVYLRVGSCWGQRSSNLETGYECKSVEGSVIETHGSIDTKILEGSLQIPFRFQLVSKHVDLLRDGILGRDILKQMQAKICYQSRALTFTYAGVTITKSLSNNSSGKNLTNSGERASRIRIPPLPRL